MATAFEQDGELAVFRLIQRNDRHAMDVLMSRNSRWVRGLVYAQLGDVTATEDVLQRVWLRVWEHAASVRDVRTWRGWLYRLARNLACDEARAWRHEREAIDRTAARTLAASPEPARPDGELGDEERRRLVLGAIRGVPPIYRETLVLRYLEDWSYRRIAEVLELSVDTVETRLVRARRLLREALDGKV